MAKLRVVAPGEDGSPPREISMTEAVEAVMKEALADHPAVVFIAWEAAGKLSCRALPDSVMLQKGFVASLYEILFEDGELLDE